MPTARLLISSSFLLAIPCLPLAAAEMTLSDLRLGVGALSTDYAGGSTGRIFDQGGNPIGTSTAYQGDADSNWRGQLQYVAGHLGEGGGLVYGAGVAVNSASWDDDGRDARMTTPVVNVLLGYGYALTPGWHLELTAFAGYGRAYFSVTDDGSTDVGDEWLSYAEYGAKIGTYLAMDSGLLLGVEVPYLVGQLDLDYDYDDGADRVSVSDERRNQGFGLMLVIGGRF